MHCGTHMPAMHPHARHALTCPPCTILAVGPGRSPRPTLRRNLCATCTPREHAYLTPMPSHAVTRGLLGVYLRQICLMLMVGPATRARLIDVLFGGA